MQQQKFDANNCQDWICPDLTKDWKLDSLRRSKPVTLRSRSGKVAYEFSRLEGYALKHFTGQYSVAQVQHLCNFLNDDAIAPNLVVELIEKLFTLGVLSNSPEKHKQLNKSENYVTSDTENLAQLVDESESQPALHFPILKSIVHWIQHPDGYWLLRNPENVTFLQVEHRDKLIISLFGKQPLAEIIELTKIEAEELQNLLKLLTVTGMIEGTQPPKPPRKKFHILQLLSFQIPLFNPDQWLNKHLAKVRFIFTTSFFYFLLQILTLTLIISLAQLPRIIETGQQLWEKQGIILLLPLAMLLMVVVSLHELAHAFTLKHYGGIVPEIGLLFICLLPGAYTNTTDAYCLVRRRQRALVVAAGVICQLSVGAIAWGLWNLFSPNSWWNTGSYLLMIAALLTVVMNLNPLNKFDGYYLAVALTGINNLRKRSFQLYIDLFKNRPINEKADDQTILLAYAPASLLYTIWVFSNLLIWLSKILRDNLTATLITLVVLVVWALYFYLPFSTPKLRSK